MLGLNRLDIARHRLLRARAERGPRGTEVAEIGRRIQELEPWYQPVDLGHGLVAPARDKDGTEHSPRWSRDRGLGKFRGFVAPQLPVPLAGARVLEIGCNAGLHLVECERRGARECIGLEIDEHYFAQAQFVLESLERLRGRPVPIRIFRGAMEDYDLEQLGRFDIALMLMVIYHVGRFDRQRALSDEETFARQVDTVRRVARVARHVVFGANPLFDEGYGKGVGSLRAIVDAAGLEVVAEKSHRHPRGHVLVARDPHWSEPLEDVGLDRMISKYFLPPAASAEREYADAYAAGRPGEGTRYHRLRTARDTWLDPGQAHLPQDLDRPPVYWVMPWSVKHRAFDAGAQAARDREFPKTRERFHELIESLRRDGYVPERGPVRAFKLVHPERGTVYQYIDGNQRLGALAHLAAERGEDPTVRVRVEQEVHRDRLLEQPLTRQLVERGTFTEGDVLRWFDHAFDALA